MTVDLLQAPRPASSRHPQTGTDAAARATMRAQIARLEQQLSLLTFELGMPGRSIAIAPLQAPAAPGAPRLLGLDELEAVRDGLVWKLRAAQHSLDHQLAVEALARRRLDAMLEDPPAHRFERLERGALGEPGCGAYEVRPRLGLLGMLFGWWCVKLSSGCP